MSNIEKPTKNAIIEIINKVGNIELGKPFQREIFLIDTHVAGTTYVEDIDAIGENIVKGTKLNFFREKDNKYDELAIIIKDEKGNKIGYVPKEKNEVLARLMDAGKLIYGIVEDKEYIDNWLKIDISIYLKD
ncbi:HIRAN domain-containing protein [Keratinibaculum paraultunense]|uniref:HIRAN domain-containing protein n=1 Tax=Keratinibaculum paraultunense TaxID=1278232 RepID=A0A4R3KYX8_9FIRM|nr:HIRAN domain-containing protein [Keratinibaculum paraultunense]QQY78910.1 HIRAN domain-containing protein [Keratinibaculum paraultunense]TCS90524.1 HIRAN domain-containing protein [Keratinibaculum paraultunense]